MLLNACWYAVIFFFSCFNFIHFFLGFLYINLTNYFLTTFFFLFLHFFIFVLFQPQTAVVQHLIFCSRYLKAVYCAYNAYFFNVQYVCDLVMGAITLKKISVVFRPDAEHFYSSINMFSFSPT